jgi:hypothetical protein
MIRLDHITRQAIKKLTKEAIKEAVEEDLKIVGKESERSNEALAMIRIELWCILVALVLMALRKEGIL